MAKSKSVGIPGIPTEYSRSTDTKRFDAGPDHKVAVPEPKETDFGAPRPWRIGLMLLQMQVEVVFTLTDEIALGRSYPATELFDGIDFSPFDGYEMGISRNHASLRLFEDRVVLIDNDSANGTFVNGKKVAPGDAYPLRNGDLIKLGMLDLTIHLLTNPFVF